MTGHVGVQNLEVSCVIGVHAEERSAKQTLLVDVDVSYDITNAVKHDRITEVLNYSRIATMVEDLLTWQQYHLLESACFGIVEMLKHAYIDYLHSVEVKVYKPRQTKTYYASFSWSI